LVTTSSYKSARVPNSSALATRARLDWDAGAERFTNNEQANELLDYEYRDPWTHA